MYGCSQAIPVNMKLVFLEIHALDVFFLSCFCAVKKVFIFLILLLKKRAFLLAGEKSILFDT